MMKRYLYILLMCVAMTACDRSVTDSGGGGTDVSPSGAGAGVRPGVGNPADENVMLGDNVPRYISHDLAMRGDEPGILVSRDSAGNYSFVNLDSREKVDIIVGAGFSDIRIVECGKEIRPDVSSVIGDDGATIWIRADIAEGGIAVVLPYF
ncbi:MAG: hypothetical protein K2L14_07055 [Duncaniella sp.]|nr:hypothetical protein [Duncaniella sp.]